MPTTKARSIDSSSEHSSDNLVDGMNALQLAQRGSTGADETTPSTKKKKRRNRKKKTGKTPVIDQAFNSYFGDQNKLANWQRLCVDVRIEEVPPSIKKCREALSKVWVNIHDLLAAQKNGTEVRRFNSCRELARYTKEQKKFYPKGKAKKGGPVRALLARLGRELK